MAAIPVPTAAVAPAARSTWVASAACCASSARPMEASSTAAMPAPAPMIAVGAV